MEETSLPGNTGPSMPPSTPKSAKKHLPEVIPVRNFKEYVGESLLIIFSVILALIFTEIINRVNERKETRELLRDVRAELIHNKKVAEDQYHYHLYILKRIDSVLNHPEIAQTFIAHGEVNFDLVVPEGVLKGELLEVAWEVAKSHNIASRTDIATLTLLTSIYHDQERVIKVEDEIGKIFFDPQSRKPENIRITLILMRDSFTAWATGRAPHLLQKYQEAIDHLDKE
jgi:hypothetical protein